MSTRLAAVVLWAAGVLFPAIALAQQPEERLTVTVAAGQLRPLDLTLRETGPSGTWTADLDWAMTRHVRVGLTFGSWNRTTPSFDASTLAADGSLATIVTERERITSRFAGFSLTAAAPYKRLRLASGIAMGVSALSTDTSRIQCVAEGLNCAPGPPLSSHMVTAQTVFSFQGRLEAGLALTRRVTALAQFTFTLPAALGLATNAVVVGLRVGLK